jgi:predicted nucleic acid-binding protein
VKLSQALDGVTLLGVDTAPFIYLVERHPVYIDRVRAVFQQVNSGNLRVITSAVTIPEVLAMPIAKKTANYEREYREMLLNTDNITTTPVSIVIADIAASLRGRYNLKTPDALHLATAIESGCQAFLTNDHGVKRVTELRVLVLDELELDPA